MFQKRDSFSGGWWKFTTRVRVEWESDEKINALIRIGQQIQDWLKNCTLKYVGHQENNRPVTIDLVVKKAQNTLESKEYQPFILYLKNEFAPIKSQNQGGCK